MGDGVLLRVTELDLEVDAKIENDGVDSGFGTKSEWDSKVVLGNQERSEIPR